jgi:hypothetical protein
MEDFIITEDAKKLASFYNEENENNLIGALRHYYAENFKNGDSGEAFLLWIETSIFPNGISE